MRNLLCITILALLSLSVNSCRGDDPSRMTLEERLEGDFTCVCRKVSSGSYPDFEPVTRTWDQVYTVSLHNGRTDSLKIGDKYFRWISGDLTADEEMVYEYEGRFPATVTFLTDFPTLRHYRSHGGNWGGYTINCSCSKE